MNKKASSVIVFVLLICQPLLADGTRVDTSFFSESLRIQRMVDIYLPESYNPDEDVSYPAIYFLHGAGGNQNSYPEIINILDTLIEGGYIQPVIVVKPNGFIGPYAGSMWTNSELYGAFEDFVIYDLIEFVEQSYNVYSDRNYRGITGHSMGGIGCMKIALAHPDMFRAVASLSGALDLNAGIPIWIPHILSETGGSPPYNYSPFNGTFSLLTFTAAGAFSPNLDNLPFYLDFPLDSDGNIVDSVYERWLPHNPANMVSMLPPDHEMAIYFDCGTYDHLEFYPMNTAFAESLDNYSIEYRFDVFSGDHYSETRPPVAFMFLDSVMNTPTSIDDEDFYLPYGFVLSQNYPNPFNAKTTIEFEMIKTGYVTLDVFDILGRHIETLVDAAIEAGKHEIIWDASVQPSGIYFYKIKSGDKSLTKKMILLK